MFRKLLDEGQAGDNVGMPAARHRERGDVERGQVLSKPGSITPHKKFKAEVYVLTKEEGGRHTPFFTGYRPQFYFRTTDVTAPSRCRRRRDGHARRPRHGRRADLPDRHGQGAAFAIREGGDGRRGQVTEIIE